MGRLNLFRPVSLAFPTLLTFGMSLRNGSHYLPRRDSHMATVKPFAALRACPARAIQICELPYDVLSSAEARVLAAENPQSFFHVSKPEVDLAEEVDPYDSSVYEKGHSNFLRFIREGALVRDAYPNFYLYRQMMGQHSQLGLVAVTSCSEYLQNTIRKHELTRPEKEDDRVRHIERLNAQTGPAFLIYRADDLLDDCFKQKTAESSDVDFVAADGIRHTSWPIADRMTQSFIESRFAAIPALYIADGHHRSAAAARVCRERKASGSSTYFLSVIFPHNQVQILPYQRVLKDLNGWTSKELLHRLEGVFDISKTGAAKPACPHEVSLYVNGAWYTLAFRPWVLANKDPLARLDVTLLQQYVLAPLFGIQDPRTNERINFVGGIRGTAELERLVNGEDYACAFSMFPTGVQDLMSVADAGGLMPPKSTWFEPKLRDGMFCHLLE
jgi:uncharacterized protein (DUF1015 family)